jgi:hypothetical protein
MSILFSGTVRAMDGAAGAPMDGFTAFPENNMLVAAIRPASIGLASRRCAH